MCHDHITNTLFWISITVILILFMGFDTFIRVMILIIILLLIAWPVLYFLHRDHHLEKISRFRTQHPVKFIFCMTGVFLIVSGIILLVCFVDPTA